MYSKKTRKINITVNPYFLDDQSEPEEQHFVWAYQVTIDNQGSEKVQLKNRYWKIIDSNGSEQEVKGEGVVGEQPILNPGEKFEYSMKEKSISTVKVLKTYALEIGILEKECNDLNKRFFTFFVKKRPYIILKWAETPDGFISPKFKTKKKPVWITNKKSRQLVHQWRSQEQAILVGTTTVIKDNPCLTTRDWNGSSPIRVVIDKRLKIPFDATIFDCNIKTIVVTEIKKENKLHLTYEIIDFSKNISHQICDLLCEYKVQSLIVEGGTKTLQTFINHNFWDEARVFRGTALFDEGTKAPSIKGQKISETKIEQDFLKILLND